jgi:hypothetical protein
VYEPQNSLRVWKMCVVVLGAPIVLTTLSTRRYDVSGCAGE